MHASIVPDYATNEIDRIIALLGEEARPIIWKLAIDVAGSRLKWNRCREQDEVPMPHERSDKRFGSYRGKVLTDLDPRTLDANGLGGSELSCDSQPKASSATNVENGTNLDFIVYQAQYAFCRV